MDNQQSKSNQMPAGEVWTQEELDEIKARGHLRWLESIYVPALENVAEAIRRVKASRTGQSVTEVESKLREQFDAQTALDEALTQLDLIQMGRSDA